MLLTFLKTTCVFFPISQPDMYDQVQIGPFEVATSLHSLVRVSLAGRKSLPCIPMLCLES